MGWMGLQLHRVPEMNMGWMIWNVMLRTFVKCVFSPSQFRISHSIQFYPHISSPLWLVRRWYGFVWNWGTQIFDAWSWFCYIPMTMAVTGDQLYPMATQIDTPWAAASSWGSSCWNLPATGRGRRTETPGGQKIVGWTSVDPNWGHERNPWGIYSLIYIYI